MLRVSSFGCIVSGIGVCVSCLVLCGSRFVSRVQNVGVRVEGDLLRWVVTGDGKSWYLTQMAVISPWSDPIPSHHIQI